ncbi:MAG TPA: M28 family peptidase [Sediminibacterium sp.]|uniref:M28 family peptidase n=1 Tax=Sediminibacterium sp. TaxID=1917865 RepID=UPI0008B07232|nr:M28 family peptidase [Sediminibacterium sp.]OHC84665.1 MAG: aminopeptidase [Sphingobacteriia bacterium RIFOXYC2_FULL_35_18]OHC87582.1 MAG: aminopeptidase [Sphingobacteriia bacterium RIFOXYD2_FULL_35_12]HLD52944.1 M28 family peptidase [Sediminibacterium sp.]
MKFFVSFLFVGLISTAVQGQVKPEWAEVFQKMNTEIDQHSKAYSSLKTATETIGHRLTGSENGKKAETFAYNLLKSYGFKDVKYQPFEVESWSRGSLSVKIGTDLNNLQTVKSVSLAHAPVKANVKLELVDMGNGLEEDYINNPGKVTGKIAVVYLGILPGSKAGLKNLHRSEKTALSTKYGAKGIIIINTATGGILLTGTASVTGKLIPDPAVCIGKEDGLKLKEAMKQSTHYASIDMTNQSGLIKARNVIATIKGKTLPKEKVIVGGHLDSWDLATGAIDNGIGSFAVIDMARTYMALKLQPERTVEFVLFMGEEEGLLGSRAYVDEAIKNNTLDQVRYMLNYDMTNDPKGFSTTIAESKDLFVGIGAIAQTFDTSFKNLFNNGAGLHSDHQPFMLYGIPTGGGAGGRLPNNAGPCYHADCDDFKLVDEKGLKNTVRNGAMLLYGIADSKELKSRRFTDTEVRDFMIKNNLKEALEIAGEWRWK